jgi:hypothetical protein
MASFNIFQQRRPSAGFQYAPPSSLSPSPPDLAGDYHFAPAPPPPPLPPSRKPVSRPLPPPPPPSLSAAEKFHSAHLEKLLPDPADLAAYRAITAALCSYVEPADRFSVKNSGADYFTISFHVPLAQEKIPPPPMTAAAAQQENYALYAVPSSSLRLPALEAAVKAKPEAVREILVEWPPVGQGGEHALLHVTLQVFRQEVVRLRSLSPEDPRLLMQGAPAWNSGPDTPCFQYVRHRGVGLQEAQLRELTLHPKDSSAILQVCQLVYNMCEDLPRLSFSLVTDTKNELYQLRFQGMHELRYSFLEYLLEAFFPSAVDCCMRASGLEDRQLTISLRSAASSLPPKCGLARRTCAPEPFFSLGAAGNPVTWLGNKLSVVASSFTASLRGDILRRKNVPANSSSSSMEMDFQGGEDDADILYVDDNPRSQKKRRE